MGKPLVPDTSPEGYSSWAEYELATRRPDEIIAKIVGNGFKDLEAFMYYCKFVYVPHKYDRSNVCLFEVITHLQIDVLAELEKKGRFTYVLKSRKEGISTLYAAWNHRHIAYIENFESLVTSLDDESAKYIKTIYQYIHDHLPKEIQPLLVNQTKYVMIYANGGHLRSMTASTDGARGSTPRSIHATEFAQYSDITRMLRAAMSSAAGDCEVVLESTAKGMNEAYDMWNNEKNGYKKIFITWMFSPNCVQDECEGDPPDELLDLQKEFGFSDKHLYWATDIFHQRLGSNWDSFCQEYPPRPEDAFIASGSRFFKGILFREARFNEDRDIGYREYRPPQPYTRYTMGVDVAGGSPTGDYSAFTILECSNPLKPKIAACFYQRLAVIDFVEVAHRYASRFYDPHMIIEINGGYGSDFMTRIRNMGYNRLYRRRIEDRITNRLIERLGWHTSDATRPSIFSILYAYLRGTRWQNQPIEKLIAIDERLQFEINSVVYADNGKIMHASGKHDDLTIATGLSLLAMDQAAGKEPVVKRNRPVGNREILEFEAATGIMYDQLPIDYFDDFDPLASDFDENFPISPGRIG